MEGAIYIYSTLCNYSPFVMIAAIPCEKSSFFFHPNSVLVLIALSFSSRHVVVLSKPERPPRYGAVQAESEKMADVT